MKEFLNALKSYSQNYNWIIEKGVIKTTTKEDPYFVVWRHNKSITDKLTSQEMWTVWNTTDKIGRYYDPELRKEFLRILGLIE